MTYRQNRPVWCSPQKRIPSEGPYTICPRSIFPDEERREATLLASPDPSSTLHAITTATEGWNERPFFPILSPTRFAASCRIVRNRTDKPRPAQRQNQPACDFDPRRLLGEHHHLVGHAQDIMQAARGEAVAERPRDPVAGIGHHNRAGQPLMDDPDPAGARPPRGSMGQLSPDSVWSTGGG